METISSTDSVSFDRRRIYRPFLERINPIAAPTELLENGLIVQSGCDPRDTLQPSIHQALADAAELNRGTQMAIVGGVGSGKTTELHLTQSILRRHTDAVNILVDMADYADFSATNTGAILAVAGIKLYERLTMGDAAITQEITSAHEKLRKLAFGTTSWVDPSELYDRYDPEDDFVQVHSPGVVRLRFAAVRREVEEIKDLLLSMAAPFMEKDAQITLLIDGLDRLIRADRFREFAEQDLQALRGTKISVVIVAPLLLWFDKSRFLQDYFDVVKHIPAVAPTPRNAIFLRQVLERRGALDVMDPSILSSMIKYSGGVLRDLLTLARSAAEYAYREQQNRIGRGQVQSAIRQLGNRYRAGLGSAHQRVLLKLRSTKAFQTDDRIARELLVNRQVLEYFRQGREYFAIHPALGKVMLQDR